MQKAAIILVLASISLTLLSACGNDTPTATVPPAIAPTVVQAAETPAGNTSQPPVPPAAGKWAIGSDVGLQKGTQIRQGPSFDFCYHTVVPEDGWTVRVTNGPRKDQNGQTWYDTSRKAAGDPSGGTGWVHFEQATSAAPALEPGTYCPATSGSANPPPTDTTAPPLPPTDAPIPPTVPPAAQSPVELIPYNYKSVELSDGFNAGLVNLALVNTSDRWLDVSPLQLTADKVETLEGKDYPAGIAATDATIRLPPHYPVGIYRNDSSSDLDQGKYVYQLQFKYAPAAHPNRAFINLAGLKLPINLSAPQVTQNYVEAPKDVAVEPFSRIPVVLQSLYPKFEFQEFETPKCVKSIGTFATYSTYLLTLSVHNTNQLDQEQFQMNAGIWVSTGAYHPVNISTQLGPDPSMQSVKLFQWSWDAPLDRDYVSHLLIPGSDGRVLAFNLECTKP